MTLETIAILLVAGLAGGMANAIAGGATLITFPAMMAAGLPPIIANASNAVATSSGNLMAALSERRMLPALSGLLWTAYAAAGLGGALGGLLLLHTSERTFVMVVPFLIGLATLVFAYSKRIQTWISGHSGGTDNGALRAFLVVPAAAYGGYFGAGLGVVLMAVLSATSRWELRSANAVKNVMSVLANAAAIVIFAVRGVISWPETLVMMAAALLGGFLGARLLRVLPATAVRKGIVAIGSAMTVLYAWRYWT